MRKLATSVLAGFVTLGGLLSAVVPASADTAGRPDDGTPDETYTNVQGQSFSEDKSGGASAPQSGGSGLSPELTPPLVAPPASADSVGFPYVKFNWSITSWYSTADGLRFYGAYYHNEQILYDYRAPWVSLGGTRYALTTARMVSGPDLLVYNTPAMFLVKAKYSLVSPNVDVTVVTRFYGNGNMEPWVLVDGKGSSYNIEVGQRFDFDLGGADDDNQHYYDGVAWSYSTTEHYTADASYGEDPNGYQWKTFDTDVLGSSYVIDQEVDVTPYHPDASKWHGLVWANAQLSGDPGSYDNDQTINAYSGSQADPWIGADAVNWYVSTYTGSALAYPGPWIKAVV